MKPKELSYRQRLMLHVNSAVSSNEENVSFPHGFHAYAQCAAKCKNKKLSWNWF